MFLSLVGTIPILYAIIRYGIPVEDQLLIGIYHYIILVTSLGVLLFTFYEIGRSRNRQNWVRLTISASLLISGAILGLWGDLKDIYTASSIYLILIGLTSLPAERIGLLFVNLNIKPYSALLLSFLFLILTGALLLSLPGASSSGKPISFIDALFTATSAVCVTGLVVLDTGKDFSIFGQIVILILIQLGALGLVTFALLLVITRGGKIGIKSTSAITNLLDAESIPVMRRYISHMFIITFVVELLGAILLYPGFKSANTSQPLYQAIFHSISAFCNAGFSLFSNSLEGFANNPYILLVVSFLIIIGGLGFRVISEIVDYITSKGIKKISAYSKIVLLTSLVLIVGGWIIMAIFEWNNTLANLNSIPDKIVNALFQSVTTRTAGFNSIDISNLAIPTVMITILLMFIGASSGSTGGGIKTGTIATIILKLVSLLKGKEYTIAFKREIPQEAIDKAITIFLISTIYIITMGIISISIELKKASIDVIFELVSAFGTVGLSRGITSDLSTLTKIIIIITMFIGRVGPLALMLALIGRQTRRIHVRYPSANIMIG